MAIFNNKNYNPNFISIYNTSLCLDHAHSWLISLKNQPYYEPNMTQIHSPLQGHRDHRGVQRAANHG